MKKILLGMMALVGVLFVSCEKEFELWDPSAGSPKEYPVYMSFAQSEYTASIEKGCTYVYFPFYAELKDGKKDVGIQEYVSVDVVEEGTTAQNNTHYSFGEGINDRLHVWTNPESETLGGIYIFSKNIDKELTLVLAIKAGDVEAPANASSANDRPKIDTMTIILKPFVPAS